MNNEKESDICNNCCNIINCNWSDFAFLTKEKVSITVEEFKDIFKEKGYIVEDVKKQMEQYSYVEKAYIAAKDDHQIEFYVLSNDEYAIGFYNTNKSIFENSKGNTSAASTIGINNYSKYSLTTNNKYKCVSRVDNTVLYVDVNTDVKNEVKDIIKEIGY